MSTRWLSVAVIFGAWFIEAGSAEAQFYYGIGGYGAGTTPIGSALAGAGISMMGAGQFMQGAGQFNTLSGQAAISYQQAYNIAIDNRLKYEQAYFQSRRNNASARAEMAGMRPRYSPEQYAADNHARTPGRLLPSEWYPSREVFTWPKTLANDEFADDRVQIEALFVARDAEPSAAGLGTANYRQIREAVMIMSDHLHSLIHQMSPDEYIPARKFLKSLEYEARFAPSTAMASVK